MFPTYYYKQSSIGITLQVQLLVLRSLQSNPGRMLKLATPKFRMCVSLQRLKRMIGILYVTIEYF
jgi:hypothetical protein